MSLFFLMLMIPSLDCLAAAQPSATAAGVRVQAAGVHTELSGAA
jgi:hypothetical protein